MSDKKSTEYKNGFDAGLNGANETNSHFSNFSTAEQTSDWEAGQSDGKKEKAKRSGKQKKANPRKK